MQPTLRPPKPVAAGPVTMDTLIERLPPSYRVRKRRGKKYVRWTLTAKVK